MHFMPEASCTKALSQSFLKRMCHPSYPAPASLGGRRLYLSILEIETAEDKARANGRADRRSPAVMSIVYKVRMLLLYF